MLLPDSRVYVAGHTGLAGSAICRRLEAEGHRNLLLRTHTELELTDDGAVERFFAAEKPSHVILAAAKVGGIAANAAFPAEFLSVNLRIAANVIESAWRHGAEKLLYLASSCIYPRLTPQPIREEALLTGPLEPTNEAYAIAKIAGLKLCQAYRRQHGFDAIVAMPTNLYGPQDRFDPEAGHVLPALLRRFHEAKETDAPDVTVWGSGSPRRDFLHADDLAAACLAMLRGYSDEMPVNIGSGGDTSIRDLAFLIAEITGYRGAITFDSSRPDGTPEKRLDITRITALGWRPAIDLRSGIEQTYRWYRENCARETATV
ncbi:GDP-L-fucose synthase family protein [Oceanibaculum indicum]|uniref:GDP-L-fucose synthase n=1 Tax=Oceanibaculum indicum TaxID=526216 RepID=A0A420WFZ5_9PROT|nr:GDP-L-fucose synthase [Oceanibaculum indicum]RKQ69920.1 GDP-L-fucose synthase [Oceanibaculum indicum]